MRKLLLVMGTTLVLLLAAAPAARAANPPEFPRPTVSVQGTSVTTSHDPGVTAAGTPDTTSGANTRLPRTGSDSGVVIWIGVALLGSGAFAVSTFRRRARAS